MHAVSLDADFIAVSFPRSAEDMAEARRLVREGVDTRRWWPKSNAQKHWQPWNH